MQFHEKRRQQFLSENSYHAALEDIPKAIRMLESAPAGSGSSESEGWLISYRVVASDLFSLLILKYTAGEPIESLRTELEAVVSAYERCAIADRNYHNDPDRPVFIFTHVDDYCRLVQLIGLCYLLHRRDLLPRIANLCDGFKGEDTLYEDLLAFALPDREDVDEWFWDKPYGNLIKAFYQDGESERLACLNAFLKRWYKDLSGAGWHDAHKPDAQGRTGGYHGYWSFEAGAAVLLLGIEGDTSLHSYLYYPKDLVAWAKANANVQADADAAATRLRCESGEPCPKVGYWMTPAKAGSRRYFQQGEIMPSIASDYGSTIWQWDSDQSDPKL